MAPVSNERFLNITRKKYLQAVENAKPMFAWFSLTENCNINCRFCFTNARLCTKNSFSGRPELNTSQVCKIIDNVSNAGTQAIQFAGGEPLLRNDISDIVSHAVHNDIYVALNTNGILIDKHIATSLANAGLSQVKVSIDGLRENHDWNRGKGNYDKAIHALKLFRDHGVSSVFLIMTLSSINYDDLIPIVELTEDMGVRFIMVEFLPTGHSSGKHKWALSKEQLRNAQRYLWDMQKQRGLNSIQFENRYIVSEQELTKKLLADPDTSCDFYNFGVGCISGIYSYMITSKGNVSTGCMIQHEIENSNLLTNRMEDIWKNSALFKKLRARENMEGKCGKCTYLYVCGGCRRSAFIQEGDFMESDPNCWVVNCTIPE